MVKDDLISIPADYVSSDESTQNHFLTSNCLLVKNFGFEYDLPITADFVFF